MRGINLPQTFERRGTTVPFHQKDLGHTRVREYFHGQERILEAAIPNFSGGRRGELVVVPWEQLPGIATLDQRDQIGGAHVCTPATNAHLVCRLLLEKKHEKPTR